MIGSSRSTFGLLTAVAVLAATGLLAAAEPTNADNFKGLIAEKELNAVINHSVKMVEDAAKTPGRFRENAETAEIELYTLILLGEAAFANGDKRGPVVRDAALDMLETIETYRQAAAAKPVDKDTMDKAYKVIKDQASHLIKWQEFKPAGAAVPVEKSLKLKQLMKAVKNSDIEMNKTLKLTGAAWKNKATQEEIVANSTKMLALTIGMIAHTPAKNPDVKAGQTVKLWQDSTKQVREGMVDLVKAASAGDAKGYKEAYNNASKGCTDCHTKYRMTP